MRPSSACKSDMAVLSFLAVGDLGFRAEVRSRWEKRRDAVGGMAKALAMEKLVVGNTENESLKVGRYVSGRKRRRICMLLARASYAARCGSSASPQSPQQTND